MRSTINIKRAHDEKISFWFASGSIHIIYQPVFIAVGGGPTHRLLDLHPRGLFLKQHMRQQMWYHTTAAILKVLTEKLINSATHKRGHVRSRA